MTSPRLVLPARSAVLVLLAAALGILLIYQIVYAQSDSTVPGNLTATIVDGGVKLDWEAPEEDADTVTGYEIQRSRPRKGENTLGTYVADTGSTRTEYTDTDATEAGRCTYTGSWPCAKVPGPTSASRKFRPTHRLPRLLPHPHPCQRQLPLPRLY